MKLTDLIPYLQDTAKWDSLLSASGIDADTEEVLIYALDKIELESDLLLIEIEKTEDDLEIDLDGRKYVQILPSSLAQELVTIDFVGLLSDAAIAQRLIQYAINDA